MDAFATRLLETSKKRGSKVILNADIEDWRMLCDFLRSANRDFAAVKVHPESSLIWKRSHEAAVKALRRVTGGLPVILDAKLADIKESNIRKARFYFSKGYDAITLHAFEGKEAVRPVVELAQETDRGTFLVAGMTSPGNLFATEQTKTIVGYANALGATGVVGPGNDYEKLAVIRKLLDTNLLVLSPGIGVQGGSEDKALEYADFVMIGRSVLRN